MRRALLCLCLLPALAPAVGCSNHKNLLGPVAAREQGPAEDPRYPKETWPARDRERSARPMDDRLAPPIYSDRPSPSGR